MPQKIVFGIEFLQHYCLRFARLNFICKNYLSKSPLKQKVWRGKIRIHAHKSTRPHKTCRANRYIKGSPAKCLPPSKYFYAFAFIKKSMQFFFPQSAS